MIRSRAYAPVTATFALVVALGGTSYAAGMITGADIKDGSLHTADLARSAVTSAKVRDHTLRGSDFAAGTLRPGPAGPVGPAGAIGPAGPSQVLESTEPGRIYQQLPAPPAERTMASLTLPVPGSYEIVAHAGFIGGSASGVVGCDARHGGASVVAEFQTVAASAYSSLEMHAALVLTGNETGVVTLFCRQATGSTSAAGGANLTAIKVGAVTLQ